MKQNQRLNSSEIRELQNRKLRALIKNSYDHVPYYHRLFKKASLRPDDIKTVDDLDKIPISKKTDLAGKPIENITANNIDLRTCLVQGTSGSTGIPLTIYHERAARIVSSEFQNYFLQFNCGDKLTNKRVTIAGAWMRPPQKFIQKLGIWRTKNISPFNPLKIQLEEIRAFNPRTLITFPSCVVPLAREIGESDFKGIQLSLIFTSGEFLHENIRDYLMKTFEANVFDSYGTNEVGKICGECMEHNNHIMSDTVFVEMTQAGETVSAGEKGEITVTNLLHYAQPFIRYNLEDFGNMLNDECTCGSHFPLMKLISGRVSDLIHLPDGRAISAHQVTRFFPVMQDIKQYQIIQETTDRLTVKLVKGLGFKESMIAEIVQTFYKRLGNDVDINVSVVDHIPREKSGKFKVFKTNIPLNIPTK
jgi:phenylacetate-CoA ligase